MGIIAGILEESTPEVLVSKLKAMMECQSHRDKHAPVIHRARNLAIGMANKHDSIFCKRNENRNKENGKNYVVHAFVDGIVLEVLKLKNELEKYGHKIPVPLCSSIVKAAYEQWGLDFMDHLEGEFACAIWDEKQNRLVLVRDPFGHKPIHYYKDHHRLIFSSEIKGVLETSVEREVDLVSFSDYLSLNCIPCPATIFKGIYQVPPGSLLNYENGEITIKSHWSPVMSESHSIAFEDAAEVLCEKLKSAIKKRMVTEKTYSFLSGGIDSSAIVSFAAEMSDSPIQAISVGFEEVEENELLDAQRMAKHVGANLHQMVVKPDSFFDVLDNLVFYHDQPFTDTSAYPTYFAGQLASGHTDIILTGDGPDQSMAGSDHCVFALQNNLFAKKNKSYKSICALGSKFIEPLCKNPTPTLFSKIQRKLYRESLHPVHAAYDLRSYFPDIVKKYICNEELWEVHKKNDPYRHPYAWFDKFKNIDPINNYLYSDMVFYVPDDLMIKVDRMCMANGLETLSPFQDKYLSDYVNSLPIDFKIRVNSDSSISTKYILRKICENRFPKSILKKKKQGFGIPIRKWLKQNKGIMLKEIILDGVQMNCDYFSKHSIESMMDSYLLNNGDYYYPNDNMIASIINFDCWHRQYNN